MKIGIIGGSGLDDPKLLKEFKELHLDTPYGNPSSPITSGKIKDLEVFIIARHGKKHEITPTYVNNRANVFALKKLGCTHIIATTAVGSLREEIGRGHFVILSDFIDFTKRRITTFYDTFEKGIVHASLANPFSEFLREKAIESARDLGLKVHKKGTVVTIEGPRFSTKAESCMFRAWGADVINMSIAPEAILAREAGLEYSAIAMSTDYDCWKDDESPVSWEAVLEIFAQNADKMKALLVRLAEKIAEGEILKKDQEFIRSRIRTIPNWPKEGVMFRDITTLLKDAEGFARTIKILEDRYKNKDIDLIAGIESRGFILASALASRLGKGMVLVRKPGKLPGETIQEDYELEYGKNTVEIHKDAVSPGQKVLLVDDLVASGGTCVAAGNLIEKLGGEIVECAFVVELPELGGRAKIRWPIFKIVDFEGE